MGMSTSLTSVPSSSARAELILIRNEFAQRMLKGRTILYKKNTTYGKTITICNKKCCTVTDLLHHNPSGPSHAISITTAPFVQQQKKEDEKRRGKIIWGFNPRNAMQH